MKKKVMAILSILLLSIVIICVIAIRTDTFSLSKNSNFCFDNIDFGTDVNELQKEQPDAKLLYTFPGVWEEETVLVRSFYDRTLQEAINAYYHFNSQGFWKGVYEIEVEKAQEEVILEKLSAFLEPIMGGIEKKYLADYFPGDWKRFVNDNEYIRYADKSGSVFRIAKYDTEEGLCKIELQIYLGQEPMGSTPYGWPETVEECWNGEDREGGLVEKPALTYQEVWFMDFEKNAIIVDPIVRGTNPESEDWLKNEKAERITCQLSPECEIWGLLTVNSYGRLKYEELVRSELTGYYDDVWKLWYIGVNSSGEIAHIYQGFLP